MRPDNKELAKSSVSFTNAWIAIITLLFAVFVFYSFESTLFVPKWMEPFAMAMIYYLGFIILRTIVLLGLSFYEQMTHKKMGMPENFPLVSIIIPCFNEENVIEQCIRSVNKIDYPNLEILVVDDGSLDNTFIKALELSREQESRVRAIHKPNGGKWDALNHGVEEALGEYIVCIDADSVLNPDIIMKMLPYFELDPLLVAVAGNIRVGNKQGLLTQFQKLEYVIGLNFHKTAQSALNAVAIVPGPIGMFKRKILLEVGGYEQGTFAEDCDLTVKLLMHGYHVKYCPDAIAYTEAPTNIFELMTQRYRWSRGTVQAIVKNAKYMLQVRKELRNVFIILYLILETMIIPSINFIFAMLTISFALQFNIDELYGPYFIGLTLLDVSLSLYSIISEKEIKTLFLLAFIGRITYGFALEILRFYSMVDELFGVPMKWGQLIRHGIKGKGN